MGEDWTWENKFEWVGMVDTVKAGAELALQIRSGVPGAVGSAYKRERRRRAPSRKSGEGVIRLRTR